MKLCVSQKKEKMRLENDPKDQMLSIMQFHQDLSILKSG